MNRITNQEALRFSYQDTKEYLNLQKDLVFDLQAINSSYTYLICIIENLNTLGDSNKYVGHTAKENFQVLKNDYFSDLKNGESFHEAKSDTLDFIRRALRTLIKTQH